MTTEWLTRAALAALLTLSLAACGGKASDCEALEGSAVSVPR